MFFPQKKLYEKKNIKPWPLDLHEAIYCLQAVPYATDSNSLFNAINFSDELLKELINWDLATITKSALYFYLTATMENRQKRDQPDFVSSDWWYITPTILNKNVSKDVVSMVQFFYFCPYEVKIVGVKNTLHKFSLFYRLQISQESLDNLLILLNIDDLSRELLIKKTFEEKSFNQIADFLALCECSIYSNLVFTKALLFYTRAIKNKTLSITEIQGIQGKIDELFDSTLFDLETFEVFDIFESSEQFKSGSSKISVYSIYQDLLPSLTLDSNDSFIKIFELFESFLYSVEDKSIFLTNLVFENGSNFQKFIVEFCKAYSEKLKKLCQEGAAKYGVSLNTYVAAIISFCVGLLLVFASLSFGGSIRNRQDFFANKANFSGTVAFVVEKEELETTSQAESSVTPSSQSKGSRSKVGRVSNGSFASLLPTFSRQNYTRGGFLPTNAPQALESSNVGRSTPVSHTKVQQKRVLTRKTTLSYNSFQREVRTARAANFHEASLIGKKANFEITTPKEAIAFVTEEVKNAFPNCYLSISPVYEERLINGVVQKTTYATLVGTTVHYSHIDEIKRSLAGAVRQCEELLVVTKAGSIEFDHGLGTLTQRILNLTRNEAHVVALYPEQHKLITKARELMLPSGLGYTPGTGGVLDLIDGLGEANLKTILNLGESPETRDQFLNKGYDFAILEKAYNFNFLADREMVSERLEDGVSENIALAIGMDKIFNETLKEDFARFTDNLGRNPIVSGPEAADVLDVSILKATRVREHTNAIRPYVKENTRAAANFNNAENEMLATAERAYEFVAKLGGKVDKTTKQEFLDQGPMQSLEQAFVQSSELPNFGKLQKKPPSVVGSRIFVRNYQK